MNADGLCRVPIVANNPKGSVKFPAEVPIFLPQPFKCKRATKPANPRVRNDRRGLMRPGVPPAEGEIVRIGDCAARDLLLLAYLVRDGVTFAIRDRLFLGLEAQPNLLARIE